MHGRGWSMGHAAGYAAAQGNLDVLQWLQAHNVTVKRPHVLEEATLHQRPETLRWLVASGMQVSEKAYHLATAQLKLFQILCGARGPIPPQTLVAALERGHLDVMHCAIKHGASWPDCISADDTRRLRLSCQAVSQSPPVPCQIYAADTGCPLPALQHALETRRAWYQAAVYAGAAAQQHPDHAHAPLWRALNTLDRPLLRAIAILGGIDHQFH